MTRPPEDERFSDVLQQVSDALRALGVSDENTQSALLEGVRDALRSITDPDRPDTRSRVVLFDGTGARDLPDDDEDSAEEGPDLRVVNTEEAERILDRQQGVQVRVLEPPPRSRPLSAEGRIHAGWSEGERPWQTVYRGDSPRPYRLACDDGAFELAVDGMAVERVSAGQTVDVEARVIRVRAVHHLGATGRYLRL